MLGRRRTFFRRDGRAGPRVGFPGARGLLLTVAAVVGVGLWTTACGDGGEPGSSPFDDGGLLDGGPARDDGSEDAGPVAPELLLPRTGLVPEELAVLVADGDQVSEALGAYYLEARGLPMANLVELPITTGEAVMSREDFAVVQNALAEALPDGIQAFLLTWTEPYRVDCMSITTAFALGFDEAFCRTMAPCSPTAAIDYNGSASTRPFDDHGLRPTMMLAVRPDDADGEPDPDAAIAAGQALIDRGVAADDTFPTGDGYYMRTGDNARSGPRALAFSQMPELWSHDGGLRVFFRDGPGQGDDVVLRDVEDVLFYATGAVRVADIASNRYLPGAVAEHLTSFGGQVPDSGQMSILEWLEAGATASYGTVIEPCNFPQKFPEHRLLVDFYVRGNTVVEALWKSVAWPGEGLFVGEPLARPWGRQDARVEGDEVVFTTTALGPRDEGVIEAADDRDGPWRVVADGFTTARPRQVELRAPLDGARFYRLGIR
ncbi:MAG TPA: TIGR03790 family protein [Polyangiaceae bacterium LLY-WYZ-14_1]|nr:TIGR03790 family protein [Polyangiaceae bacterium LLY-WYZ-14_1]